LAYSIGNGRVFTGSALIENGVILVESGKVKNVMNAEDFNEPLDVDVKGALIMPAWVNAHTHIYSTLARGMNVDFHPLTFTQLLKQLWWRLDRALTKEEVEISAMVAAAEFIHSGVATVFDHHSSPSYVRGSLETLKEAIVDNAGMRGVFCYEISDRDGIQKEAIEENTDFYRKYEKSNFVSGMMGLHAGFTLSDETLEKISHAATDKIPMHVHVAEGVEDELSSINDFNLKIIERFEKFNLLNDKSIYAHCIHVDNDEVEKISKTGGTIVVNVQSNMNNAVGIPDVVRFLSKGAKVAMGNDGFGFSPVFGIRLLALSQKHLRGSPLAFSSKDVGGMIDTTYELAGKHLNEKFGRIESGAAADLMVVDYDPPTPITLDNFYDHLFFGITESRVVDLYVNGKPLMKDGVIKTFDEAEIRKESRKIAEKLWKRL
jgi:putative selenium metabolism protein SsnA